MENDDLDVSAKIKKLQGVDSTTCKLIERVKNNSVKGFILEDGILFKTRIAKNRRIFKQLVVPESLKLDVLMLCHDNYTGAHLGEQKTWIKVNNRFFWPNSYKETINYVKTCQTCACIKPPLPNRAPLQPILNFNQPFDKVGVDILELTTSNSNNHYIVVFTDYLTKWVEAFPLRDQKAESIA